MKRLLATFLLAQVVICAALLFPEVAAARIPEPPPWRQMHGHTTIAKTRQFCGSSPAHRRSLESRFARAEWPIRRHSLVVGQGVAV